MDREKSIQDYPPSERKAYRAGFCHSSRISSHPLEIIEGLSDALTFLDLLFHRDEDKCGLRSARSGIRKAISYISYISREYCLDLKEMDVDRNS